MLRKICASARPSDRCRIGRTLRSIPFRVDLGSNFDRFVRVAVMAEHAPYRAITPKRAVLTETPG